MRNTLSKIPYAIGGRAARFHVDVFVPTIELYAAIQTPRRPLPADDARVIEWDKIVSDVNA